MQKTSGRDQEDGNLSCSRYSCHLLQAIRRLRVVLPQQGETIDHSATNDVADQSGSKIDTNVDFPVENLNLEERCDEPRLARTLQEQGKDLQTLGLGSATKPMVYDLCEYFASTSVQALRAYSLLLCQMRSTSTMVHAEEVIILQSVRMQTMAIGTNSTTAVSIWRTCLRRRFVEAIRSPRDVIALNTPS